MLIEKAPFRGIYGSKFQRPLLPIRIINPHTKKSYKTWGLVDTGADDCAIPGKYADLIGHNLKKVKGGSTGTAGGSKPCYPHTTIIEILDFNDSIIYIVKETFIDYMPGLNVVLLGVKGFLDKFVLHIDYPKLEFSIQHPFKKTLD